jgi:hypothetical protein
LLTLYRHRLQVIPLDSASFLTRGNPIGFEPLLAHIDPRNGSFIAAFQNKQKSPRLYGQVRHVPGDRTAHLMFLLATGDGDQDGMLNLVDGLTYQAGEWGTHRILAEVQEQDRVFEVLRRCGFVVYAWQRIYRLPFVEDRSKPAAALWQFATSSDEIGIRSLFQSLVPPLVQTAEPLATHRLRGLITQQEGEIKAFVETIFGPEGIFLRPLIHPSLTNVAGLLDNLKYNLYPLLGRPVYLVVRSYHAWLEETLEEQGDCFTSRQALMVKHLSVTQRAAVPNAYRKVIEQKPTEASTPLVHNLSSSPEEKLEIERKI